MRVGVQLIFQSSGYGPEVTDGQVYDEEIEVAVLAEELGFDAVWPVEHHFFDYAFCPDNTLLLAYVAGRTNRISLGTGAVIVPWNDPLRVAEKIAMLDHLAGGRVLFGMGRGLARREYEGLGVSMDESRERFDEGAEMILEALETGFMEGSGRFYKRASTVIRPRPERTFRDRTYCVAMSPDSALSAADLGARMVLFAQKPWKEHAVVIDSYRERFRQQHATEPAAPLICDFIYCDQDLARAEEKARRHIVGYLLSVLEHYELAGEHLKEAKGYEAYGNAVDMLVAVGEERLAEAYLGIQAWGTPQQILDRLWARREIVGPFDLTCCFRYAGMPFEDAARSMRLFASEVLPVLRDDPAWATE